MNFLTINGKPQTHNGKFITVPDGYNNELIKVDGKLLKTNGSGAIYQTNEPIWKKHRINRIYLFAFDKDNKKILYTHLFDNIDIDINDDFIVPAEIFSDLFITTRSFPNERVINLKAILLDDKDGKIFTINENTRDDEDNVYIEYFQRQSNNVLNDNFCATWNFNNYVINKDTLNFSHFTIRAQTNILGYCTIFLNNSLSKGIKSIRYFCRGYFPSQYGLKEERQAMLGQVYTISVLTGKGIKYHVLCRIQSLKLPCLFI